MKLVKSLLLGSAATLVAVAGAQAADLPFRKAAPVDYVRVCDWITGGGYFYIPGTDTCLKVGGEARFEYGYVDTKNSFAPTPFTTLPAAGGVVGTFIPSKAKSASGFHTRGKIEVDVRTQTAYGLLRANVRLEGDRTGGNWNGPTLAAATGANASSVSLDRGYITFAGITAGRVQSFFDFYADNYNYEGIANSDESTTVLAYTATFGGGFSATISVEDPNGARRDSIGAIAWGNTGIGVASNGAPVAAPVTGLNVGYGGTNFPDVVGVLRYDQTWGAVQLSGAYHQVNTVTTTALTTGPANVFPSKEATGFAVQAGLDLKLPMIAAGDELWLEGAYQEGAYLYQDSAGNLNSGFFGQSVGGFQHVDVDAVAVGNPGTNGYHLELGKGFSVLGAFHHYFTPQFHDVLYGSYEEIGYGNQVKNIDWTRGGIGDASEYRVGNQFIFTPVNNLSFGVDVMYAKINQTLAKEVVGVATPLPAGIKKDPDSFQVRLQINRDF